MKRFRRLRRGFIMALSLCISALLFAVGTTLVVMTTQSLDFPANRLRVLQARYLAQAGANAALSVLKFDSTQQQTMQAVLGEGSYSVTIGPAPTQSLAGAVPPVLVITSTGTVGNGGLDATSAVLQVSAQVVCPFSQYLWGDFSTPSLNLNQTAGIDVASSTSIATGSAFTLNGPLFSNGRVVLYGQPGPLTINGSVNAVDGVYALHSSVGHGSTYDLVNPTDPTDVAFTYTSLTQTGQMPPGSGTIINGTINPTGSSQPPPTDLMAPIVASIQANPSNPRYVTMNTSDDTYVSLENNVVKVYASDGSGNVPTSSTPLQTINLNGGPGVLYINDSRYGSDTSFYPPSALAQPDPPSGTVGNDADRHGVIVSGTLNGKLTLATTGNVLVNMGHGGTQYSSNDAASSDLLTMVAGGAVNPWVAQPSTTSSSAPITMTMSGVRVSNYRPRAPVQLWYNQGHELGANSYLKDRTLTTRNQSTPSATYLADYDSRLKPNTYNYIVPPGLQTVAQPVAWYWAQQQQGH